MEKFSSSFKAGQIVTNLDIFKVGNMGWYATFS